VRTKFYQANHILEFLPRYFRFQGGFSTDDFSSEIAFEMFVVSWFAKGALPEEYLGHNFDEHCLQDTMLIWCLFYPSARRRRGFSPKLPRATWLRTNSGDIPISQFFCKNRVAADATQQNPNLRQWMCRKWTFARVAAAAS